MIKILVLSHYMVVPPITGGSMRTINPLIELGKRGGYEFTIVFRTYSPPHIIQAGEYFKQFPFVKECIGVLDKGLEAKMLGMEEFLPIPTEIFNVIGDAFRDTVVNLVQREKFDIVQCEHSHMAWIAPYVRKHSPDSALVLNLHNVEHMLYKRRVEKGDEPREIKEHFLREWMRMERWEREIFPWFDGCITISPLENQFYREIASQSYAADVPIGVPLERFPWDENWPEEKQHDIAFIGTMNWYPNAHGLVWFVDKVLPLIEKERPGTKLSIVGYSAPDDSLVQAALRNPAVTMYGEQEDEREFFASCSAFIVPLFIAAGARVKIVTAWAAGAPVVATTIGAEGLLVKNGENILISDDPKQFARHVLALLNSRETGLKLRSNARKLVEESYSLQVSADRLDGAYKKIKDCKDGRAGA